MKINFLMEEAVSKRYSVRNYSDQEVDEEKIKAIQAFINFLDNPFGKKVSFHLFDLGETGEKQRLGTYGVIKGAKHYIGSSIKLDPMVLEALGYEFEAVVLYMAYLGLGTCWLGGTFNRKGFANAMTLEEGELLPIISPFGYAADKKHIKELAMRKLIKADQRKDWNKLFFINDFNTPLSKEEAGVFEFALEMVRLGPSASNKQPWRILCKDGAWHFYEYKEPGYSDYFSYDIQRVDMGIAAAHFDFSLKEKDIAGNFITDLAPDIITPKNVEYAFSWIKRG